MYIVNFCNGREIRRFRSADRAYRAYNEYAKTRCPVFMWDNSYADGDDEIASSGYGNSPQPDTAASRAFWDR